VASLTVPAFLNDLDPNLDKIGKKAVGVRAPRSQASCLSSTGVVRSVRFRSDMRIASEKSIDEPSCFRINQEMSARMRHR
jgi:hypothetical protein